MLKVSTCANPFAGQLPKALPSFAEILGCTYLLVDLAWHYWPFSLCWICAIDITFPGVECGKSHTAASPVKQFPKLLLQMFDQNLCCAMNLWQVAVGAEGQCLSWGDDSKALCGKSFELLINASMHTQKVCLDVIQIHYLISQLLISNRPVSL